MLKKSLVAAAVVSAAAIGFTATAAQAGKVHVDVGIGVGAPGYYDPGYYAPGYYADDDYDTSYGGSFESTRRHHGSWGVSCGEARWQVKSARFRSVQAIDCSGRTYVFTGWKHGDKYRIRVSRRDGDIISVTGAY